MNTPENEISMMIPQIIKLPFSTKTEEIDGHYFRTEGIFTSSITRILVPSANSCTNGDGSYDGNFDKLVVCLSDGTKHIISSNEEKEIIHKLMNYKQK